MALMHVLRVRTDEDGRRIDAVFHLPVTDPAAQVVLALRSQPIALPDAPTEDRQALQAGQALEVVRVIRLRVDLDREQTRAALVAACQRVLAVQGPQLVAAAVEEAALAGACWDGLTWSR